MSILTKICVVVLLVLILLACPVFITQATVAPNYRQAYEAAMVETASHRMAAKNATLALNKVLAERDAAKADLARIESTKQQEIDTLKSDLAAWQTKAAEFQNNLTRLTTEVGGLKGEAQTFNERNALLASQLEAGRTEMDKLNREVIRVSDLLKQAEAEKDRLDKIARVRYERIRELEEETEQMQAGGAEKSAKAPAAPTSSEKITGTITAIKGDYASINIGSAKGVQQGMRLVIYRGAQLVGFLRVEEVDIAQAAGIVIERQLDPMQGDKVTTSLQ